MAGELMARASDKVLGCQQLIAESPQIQKKKSKAAEVVKGPGPGLGSGLGPEPEPGLNLNASDCPDVGDPRPGPGDFAGTLS